MESRFSDTLIDEKDPLDTGTNGHADAGANPRETSDQARPAKGSRSELSETGEAEGEDTPPVSTRQVGRDTGCDADAYWQARKDHCRANRGRMGGAHLGGPAEEHGAGRSRGLIEQMPRAIVLAGKRRVLDPLQATDADDLAKPGEVRNRLPRVTPISVEQEPCWLQVGKPHNHPMKDGAIPRRVRDDEVRAVEPFRHVFEGVQTRDPISLRIDIALAYARETFRFEMADQSAVARARLDEGGAVLDMAQKWTNRCRRSRVVVARVALECAALAHLPALQIADRVAGAHVSRSEEGHGDVLRALPFLAKLAHELASSLNALVVVGDVGDLIRRHARLLSALPMIKHTTLSVTKKTLTMSYRSKPTTAPSAKAAVFVMIEVR